MKDIIRKKTVKFQLQNRQRKVQINKRILHKFLSELSLMIESPPEEIGVILVSDKKIKSLNKRFLQKDSPTDTMSFSISKNYGEIIISAVTAEKNAKIYSNSPEEEILYLVIHGFLHLKGYNDYTKNDCLNMKRKQDAIFKKVRGC